MIICPVILQNCDRHIFKPEEQRQRVPRGREKVNGAAFHKRGSKSLCFFQEGSFYEGKNVQQSKQWVSASFDQSSREKTKQKLKRRWIFIKTIEGWEQLVCYRVSSSLIELTYCCQSGIGIFVIFWQINFKNKLNFQDPSKSWFVKGKSFPFVNLINWLFMFGQYKRFCLSPSVLLIPFTPCITISRRYGLL